MTRGRAARLAGVAVATILTIACGPSAPNRDGWWDRGVHEVDGYWVTGEYTCEPEDDECRVATETATDVLRQLDPGARVTRAVMAAFPVQRGQSPNETTIILAGLQQPRFVILDLADGSRRTIGLRCGPDFDQDGSNMRIVCAESDMETWRVTGS